MNSYEKENEFEKAISKFFDDINIELHKTRWVFTKLFVKLLCIWSYTVTRCKLENWKCIVAIAYESYQSGIQT